MFDLTWTLNETSIAWNLPSYNEYKEENDKLKEMLWLDIKIVDCNCSRYPNVGNVTVKSSAARSILRIETHSDSSDSSEQDLSESEEVSQNSAGVEDNETLYAEYFKLKGSTYHDHFQKALAYLRVNS